MDAEPQEQATTASADPRTQIDTRTSRRLLRWSAVLSAALTVPVLPLIVLGLSFEERIESLLDVQMTAAKRFWMIAGLLSVDLVLPVPSSALSTYGGGRIGLWPAFAASFLGMTIGAMIGYVVSSWLGEPIARRLAGETDFDRMQRLTSRIGPYALLLTRPLPILAEACVLLAGAARLPARRFFPPVLTANAAVSFIYALFGATFRSDNALPVAIGVSAGLPLLLAMIVRFRIHCDE